MPRKSPKRLSCRLPIFGSSLKLAVSGDKALDYTNINLNGHTLTLSSSSTSETCWGVVNHSEISGKGTVIINQTGMNPGVGYMNKTSIAADKIIITSDNYYGVYAESNSHHTYDGHGPCRSSPETRRHLIRNTVN